MKSVRPEDQKREYDYIILHHTATEKCMSAEDMEMSMFYTYIQNRSFDKIPTHYIVGCNGDRLKVNELEDIVGGTLNADANRRGIQIEIVGDFNKNEPNQSQYDTVNQLIEWILEKHPNMEIKGHGDFQNKNCPGSNFDWSKIKGNVTSQFANQKKQGEKITFKLSRYYTVVPNQKRYYNGRSYAEDFAINCAGDCNITANGHILTDADRGKSVACPKEYELGTRIYLEGIGEVVCNDRGGAINGNRLDMRCGIGDNALDNRASCPTGERVGYVIGK